MRTSIERIRPASPRASADDSAPVEGSQVPVQVPLTGEDTKSQVTIGSTVSARLRKLLEALEEFDSLYLCPVKKKFPDKVEAGIGRSHFVRKYEVKDYFGETKYYAAEMSSVANFWFCSTARTFKVFMFDQSGKKVFEAVRSCSFAICVCGVDTCCAGGIRTDANFIYEEDYIGSVESHCLSWTPSFEVNIDHWNEKFVIRGPTCGACVPCMLCGVKSFAIVNAVTKNSVGKIMLGYDGLQEDLIPNPNTVGIIFPPRCSTESKACFLAAGFMLDITYFQKRGFTIHRILRYTLHLAVLVGLCYLIYLYLPPFM